MKKLLLAIFIASFCIINNSYSQTTVSFNGELKGMGFSAKIDILPDCDHQTPYVRATLHSVEVNSFTYDGDHYSNQTIDGVQFPIKVKGYLTISSILEIGYYPNNRNYELNKAQLSTEIGGKGNEFFADEFRFVDGEVKKIKDQLEVGGCIDLKKKSVYKDAKFSTYQIKIHSGDLRYNDQSLNLYLKNKIENQLKTKSDFEDLISETNKYTDLTGEFEVNELESILNELNSFKKKELTNSQLDDLTERINKIEAVKEKKQEEKELETERKFESLSTYTKCSVTSNNNSIDFYKQGIKKTEELIAASNSSEEKEKLNVILKNINSCLTQRIKVKQTKDKLAGELKRDENKRKMEKMRLNKEELARINQQVAYTNKVNTYKSKGISTNEAHRMVQEEYKIDLIDNVIGTGLNQISSAIMDGINRASERKEAMYKANMQQKSNYLDWFNEYKRNIQSVNQERNEEISKLPIYKYNSDNVYDLKQEVLGLLSFKDGVKYSIRYSVSRNTSFRVTSTETVSMPSNVLSSSIIIERTIQDAYFENNQLIIQIREVCKEAEFDKNHLKNEFGKLGAQPAKFTLNSLLKYNINTGKEELYQNISWVGYTGIPNNNTYISNEDLVYQLKGLNDLQVTVPKKYNLNKTNIIDRTIASKLKKIKELQKNEEIEALKSNVSFINEFEETVLRDLENHFNTLYNGNTPNLITTKSLFTTNPNETSFIVFFMKNSTFRYMILSYPGKQLLDNINPTSIKTSNVSPYDNRVYYRSKINSQDQTFFQSSFNQEDAIGGYSGIDLLLSGTHNKTFEKNIYYYNSKNKIVNESGFLSITNKDIWNPIIEVGDVELFVERKYLQNEEVLKKFNKANKHNWINDLPLEEYRSNPEGIVLKLKPVKTSILAAAKKSNYNYTGTIKTNRIVNNNSTNGELLYYTPSSTTNLIVQKFETKDSYILPLSKVVRYDPLSYVNTITNYSDTFLNNYYKRFNEYKNHAVNGSPYSKGGSHGRFYKMFSFFNTIDLSEDGIKYKGRKPTFHSNGNLKTVGITKDGKKIGEWEYYNAQGKLTNIISYTNISKKSWEEKFDKNEIRIAFENYDWEGFIEIGEYFDPNSKTKRIVQYSDGIKYYEETYNAESIDDVGKLLETREFEDGIPIKTTKH